MAFSAVRVTVDTTAGGTVIVTTVDASSRSPRLNIRNRGAVAVYLGEVGVTALTGYQLDPGEALGFVLDDGESVSGITASSSAVVHVAKGGA
jgi:hypothetical protein